jgi:hypothetical protein
MARSGVRALGNVLEIGGLDLVAKFLDHGVARKLVLVSPAEVADRAKINESDFELLGGGSPGQACSGSEHHCRRSNENLSHGFS